jgi:hypothetical protein
VTAGCSGGSSDGRPGATATTTASPTPQQAPSDALAQLARLAGTANYSATYLFRQKTAPTTASVRVWRGSSSIRVDIVARGATATLITTAAASFACSIQRRHKVCLRVAKAGKPVPAPFNLAPVTVFSRDLKQLATHAADYTVSPPVQEAAQGGVPAATCFDVKPEAGTPAPRVAAGTYCFTADGVISRLEYAATQNSAQLVTLHTSAPAASVYRPYSSPTPLPR